jgi:hypothetical protein
MGKKSPIPGATNPRYLMFISVADGCCQNWRYLDFISQMHWLYNTHNPISSQDDFTAFIAQNKHKYKVKGG